jgi:hypothetical protein
MIRRRLPALIVALLGFALAACATTSGGAPDRGPAASFLGDYQGSFATALSPQADDDLNSCFPGQENCPGAHNPLLDITLRLTEVDGRLAADFYREPQDSAPLDLLGRSCGTRVGALESLNRDTTLPDQQYRARFTLTIENRLCAGRLRPTSSHFMIVNLFAAADGTRRAEVVIDKSVSSQNYLYVEEDGVERRVRMDLNNTPDRPQRGGYRVCIEDDAGEFSRCVITDKELKSFFLPVPLPGGVAANYTWWHDLTPNLKRTRGLYQLEQYVGKFTAVDG